MNLFVNSRVIFFVISFWLFCNMYEAVEKRISSESALIDTFSSYGPVTYERC